MKQGNQLPLTKTSINRILPAWKGSLFLFGILILIVLFYFLWQVRHLQQLFLSHSLENSTLIASVIERNARSAVLSQEAVEKIIHVFLGNTAKFIDYLDFVEPFSEKELAEFARESGLAGICIIREDNKYTLGPGKWFDPGIISCRTGEQNLIHLPVKHLFILAFQRTQDKGCIILGFKADHIEKLREQVGLTRLVKSVSGLSNIKYIRIESGRDASSKNNISYPHAEIIEYKNTRIAETRITFGNDILVLGMDTKHFLARTRQLWSEFFFFSTILCFLSIFFSWLFHKSQGKYLKRIREIERKLARQREDAALGRAAAAITHEIRNPMNAMSMGLQRLQMESDELSGEHHQLISDILKALKRTNKIVGNIRQYAKPLNPQNKKIRINEIIEHILSLYTRICEESNIKIHCELKENNEIFADPEMIEQAMENLVKNAVEAQSVNNQEVKTQHRPGENRYIKIATGLSSQDAVISIENSGFNMDKTQAEQIFEPYFTTKTRGTGIGLSIVQKIISAHQGRIKLKVPKPGIIRIIIFLPVNNR